MPDKVIRSIDEVTAEWLTAVLASNGALAQGTVASFVLGTGQGNWSTSANLTVKYPGDARGSLPQRLFLKMVNADTGDDEFFGESKVTYYTRDYVNVPNAPLLRCYDAAYYYNVTSENRSKLTSKSAVFGPDHDDYVKQIGRICAV